MAKQEATICTMFGDPCRFCSNENVVQVRQFSVIRDCHLGKKGHVGKKRATVEFGQYCNNIGAWVRDLKYCPARWALTRPKKAKAA